MELHKSSRYLKYSLFLLGTLIIGNTGVVNSSEIKQFSGVEKKTAKDFENVFYKYSLSFENYDSYSNQFDNFFGTNYLETEDKRNFQDLSISIDSKNLRDLYEDMFEGLTIPEKVKIDKEPFFKKKI
tara:strand:- start:45 stop:425 length:381 start_codon:yes stop_codon:yes gene_type:complete